MTDIVNATGVTQTNVPFHLRALHEGGFVRADRRGPSIYCCLTDPRLLRIQNDLRDWPRTDPLCRRARPGLGASPRADRSGR